MHMPIRLKKSQTLASATTTIVEILLALTQPSGAILLKNRYGTFVNLRLSIQENRL
jgi:hypothetical protein